MTSDLTATERADIARAISAAMLAERIRQAQIAIGIARTVSRKGTDQ